MPRSTPLRRFEWRRGLLDERFVDLFAESQETWDAIAHSPGSALGTSRKKLGGEDFGQMLETLRRMTFATCF